MHAISAGGSQMTGAETQAAVASTSEKLRADALLSAANAGCNNSATGRETSVTRIASALASTVVVPVRVESV